MYDTHLRVECCHLSAKCCRHEREIAGIHADVPDAQWVPMLGLQVVQEYLLDLAFRTRLKKCRWKMAWGFTRVLKGAIKGDSARIVAPACEISVVSHVHQAFLDSLRQPSYLRCTRRFRCVCCGMPSSLQHSVSPPHKTRALRVRTHMHMYVKCLSTKCRARHVSHLASCILLLVVMESLGCLRIAVPMPLDNQRCGVVSRGFASAHAVGCRFETGPTINLRFT
jgi:hypothetical protein